MCLFKQEGNLDILSSDTFLIIYGIYILKKRQKHTLNFDLPSFYRHQHHSKVIRDHILPHRKLITVCFHMQSTVKVVQK